MLVPDPQRDQTCQHTTIIDIQFLQVQSTVGYSTL